MRVLGFIVLAASAVLPAAAGAAEFCVECIGPAAMYRCAGEGPSSERDPKLQLLCASEMSRIGGHESCSVRRQSAAACDGPLRTVAVPALPIATRDGSERAAETAGASRAVPTTAPSAVPSEPREAALSSSPPQSGDAQGVVAPGPAVPPPVAAANEGPPRTVEEAAEGLVKSSSKGLKAAGNAVTQSTEKTADAVAGGAKSAGNMVVDGAKTAGNAVGQAGSAVGSAAKKGWNCVFSLFANC